jgi:hypothetical protein
MARGGKRSGAGRKTGSLSKRSQEVAAAMVATGDLPLTYMLQVMRDETADRQRRDEMAKAAAPYVHPRLSSIDGDLNLNVRRHEEALSDLE